jgi:peptidoglycan/xylan/chitin deacetylase (PgdA/CDA1 family)
MRATTKSTVSVAFVVVLLVLAFVVYRSFPFDKATGTNTPSGMPYVVQSGDSLYKIGLQLGIPWQLIASFNHIAPPYTLIAGRTFYIPAEDSGCQTAGVNLVGNQTFGAPAYNKPSPSVDTSKRVILRFDDSRQSQWVNALPVLAKYGFHASFAVITGTVLRIPVCGLTIPLEEMNWAEVSWLFQNGNEISDHTLSHPNLDHQNATGLYDQVVKSRELLQQHSVMSGTLTLPYGLGAGNATVINYILSHGFSCVYAVEGTENATSGVLGIVPQKNTVSFTWTGIDQQDGTQTLAEFESAVAHANNSTVVGLVFHSVSDHVSGTGYFVNETNFQQMMAYLYANNFDVIMPWQIPGVDLMTGY